MATTSPKLKIKLQAAGENNTTWGDPELNTALKGLEEAIAGYEAVEVAGSDVTLDTTNYTVDVGDHYRNMILKLTAGASVAARNIIVPGVEKMWFINNATGYTQTIKTSGGTGAAISDGQKRMVYCDGTDCFAHSVDSSTSTSGLIYLSTTTISGSVASVDIPISSSYALHELVFANVGFASGSSWIGMRTSADGSTFASGNSDYSYSSTVDGFVAYDNTSNAVRFWDDSNATSKSTSVDRNVSGTVVITGAADASLKTTAMACLFGASSSEPRSGQGGGYYATARADTHVRILGATNLNTGKIYVYGRQTS
jgi:hypothetical protein